jgi:hypothetical protein
LPYLGEVPAHYAPSLLPLAGVVPGSPSTYSAEVFDKKLFSLFLSGIDKIVQRRRKDPTNKKRIYPSWFSFWIAVVQCPV